MINTDNILWLFIFGTIHIKSVIKSQKPSGLQSSLGPSNQQNTQISEIVYAKCHRL